MAWQAGKIVHLPSIDPADHEASLDCQEALAWVPLRLQTLLIACIVLGTPLEVDDVPSLVHALQALADYWRELAAVVFRPPPVS